jgi:hypothetical protein
MLANHNIIIKSSHGDHIPSCSPHFPSLGAL